MNRRGVVLFITLAMMLMLSTIVLLFLRQSGSVQKSVRQERALIQTDLLLKNMGHYLKSFTLKPEDLFYAANIPVAMELGNLHATLTLSSLQSRLDINALLQAVQKDQQALDRFMEWMRRQKVRRPEVLLALLLDTEDTDLYPRGRDTEIKILNPAFQNGTIPNRRSLATILETYRLLSGDTSQTVEKWEETFGYEGKTFDLNYATFTQLSLLYPEWPPETLRRIAAHESYYADIGDLPIPDDLKTEATRPRYGITPLFETAEMAVSIPFQTPDDCRSTLTFWMHLKTKKIVHLAYAPIVCE